MKHRRITLSCLIAVFLVVGLATTANAATLSLVPSKTSIERGETFTLDIVIDDPTGVAGCAFTLTYPTDRLIAPDPQAEGEVVGITSTFFQNFNSTRMHRENTSTLGEILFSGANINPSTGGAPWTVANMIVFTVPFTVKSDAPLGDFNFTLEQTQLLNTDAGWGDGVNPEPVPVLIGAVDENHDDWLDLTKAFPVVSSTFDSPLTVTPGIELCSDTDEDGLCDSVETNTGVYVGPEDTGTDPNKADSDGDGLNDGDEVLTHSTNPVNSDSDGDGVPDGWEVANGFDPNDPSEPLAQIVSTMPDSPRRAPEASFSLDVNYTTTDNNAALTGLGLRIHYDSSKLTWDSFADVLATDLTGQDSVPSDDTQDFDSDPSTDKYLLVAWSSPQTNWPNTQLPAKLYTVNFTVAAGLQEGETSEIRFSSSSSAAGYEFVGLPATFTVQSVNCDIDGNDAADALTDGLLVIRYLFGFTGDTLINAAVAPNATRTTASEIEAYLADAQAAFLDVDGNGATDALTDGLLVIRHLFGFTGDTLINAAVAPNATRTTATEIETYLQQTMP
jgi:hypothetical protein